MIIGIVRSEAADRERTYNAVEYAAALNGVRIGGYVAPGGSGSFRGHRFLGLSELAGIDMIVAASPVTGELRRSVEEMGWRGPILSFATDKAECLAMWRDGGWLVAREARLAGGDLALPTRHARIEELALEDVPSRLSADAHEAVTRPVVRAYQRASADAPQSGPYAIGRNWQSFLRHTRPTFYRAAAAGDVQAIGGLLASCFRNEMSSGILGGREAFEAFAAAGPAVCAGVRQQFTIWRYSVRTADIGRLAAPRVGNPYGVRVDGGIVHPNTFLDDYRAGHVLRLLDGVDRPIVVDIGGGYGGFCHQLFANGGNVTYVGFDLPDNLIVASYFILAAHPEKRVLLYESPDDPLDADVLREFDVVLMPNFMLPRLADRSVECVTNFTSLSEMDFGTIAEYLRQVDRACTGFFYQENLLDNGENYEFYPVSVFPAMPHFALLSSAPSRWPFFGPASTHHCHGEFFYVNRQIDRERFFGAARPSGEAIRTAAV